MNAWKYSKHLFFRLSCFFTLFFTPSQGHIQHLYRIYLHFFPYSTSLEQNEWNDFPYFICQREYFIRQREYFFVSERRIFYRARLIFSAPFVFVVSDNGNCFESWNSRPNTAAGRWMPAEVNDSIRMLEKNTREHINSSIKTHFEMFHQNSFWNVPWNNWNDCNW